MRLANLQEHIPTDCLNVVRSGRPEQLDDGRDDLHPSYYVSM